MKKFQTLMLLCVLVSGLHAGSNSAEDAARSVVELAPIKSLHGLARDVAIKHGLPWDKLPHAPLAAEAALIVLRDTFEHSMSPLQHDKIQTGMRYEITSQYHQEKKSHRVLSKILDENGISGTRAALARCTIDNPKIWALASIIPCVYAINTCYSCAADTYCPETIPPLAILGCSMGTAIPALLTYAPKIDSAALKMLTGQTTLMATHDLSPIQYQNLERVHRIMNENTPHPAERMQLEAHLKID